jgi:hypothetical protein
MSLCDPLADRRLTWTGKREALTFVDISVDANGLVTFRRKEASVSRLEDLAVDRIYGRIREDFGE